MTGRTSEREQPGTSVTKARSAPYAVLGAACALVIGLYAWSAKPGYLELWSPNANNNYYNLLAQGFRAGQLNLKREMPSGLAQLADSSDPAASSPDRLGRSPLLDLSYYQGKLYFYFGVTPALVLFWPYVALTGHYLPHREAVVIFFSAGFLVSVGLLRALWRRYFGEVSLGVVAAGALALGLANFTLASLPRAGVYEVAISCGYALTMLTLTLLWQALHATRGRAWWLAGASLTYGLAVGARPSLLFGAMILLVPVFQGRDQVKISVPWKLVLAATGPITVIGLGLLLYNFLRFDNPFEFGHQYALSRAGQHIVQSQYGIHPFSLRFLWCNFQVYFLEPARWSGRFPFVHDITSPPLPVGHVGIEHTFGILTNVPLVWLVLAAPLIWRGRLGECRRALRWFGMVLVLLFSICALTLGLFFAACLRYEVEFLPTLLMLAVLGILGLERTVAGRPVWRRGIRWGWGLLLAFSVSFNLLAMFGVSAEHYVYRGVISFQTGRIDEAIVQFQKALASQPNNAEAHGGLGLALFQLGRVPEALGHYEESVRLKPNVAEAQNCLGKALLQQGKVLEALGHLEQAVRLKPDLAEAHNNLAAALFQLSRVPEALGHYAEAVRLKPDFANAHHNLAVALFQQGKVTEAIGHLEQALRVEPEEAHVRKSLEIARFQLGEGLAAQGKWDEAIPQYAQAIELKPDHAQAHDSLGLALSRQGKFAEATMRYRKALELDPQLASALNNLAWLLATETNGAVRSVEEAVRCAERACELTTNQVAVYLDTLGVAYSEAGRFKEAAQATERGVGRARAAGNQELAALIESRLKHYREGRPYHVISEASRP